MRQARIGGAVRLGAVVVGGVSLLSMSCAQVLGAGDYHVTSSSGEPTCSAPTIDQSLLVACVMLESCNPYSPPHETIGSCITHDIPEALPFDSCAVTASTCADIEQCVGVRYATADECKGPGAVCNGNLASTCRSAGRGATRRCDILAPGSQCKTYTTDAGAPIADCVAVPSCTDTDNMVHCSGTAAYECIGGVGFGQNCTSVETCKTEGSSTSCYGNLPSCTLSGAQCQVNTNTLVACTNYGEELQFNCGKAGLSCETLPDDAGVPTPYCLAPNCTPDDVNGCTESCNGTIANLCVGGATVSIDCTDKSLGFKSCGAFPAAPSQNITVPYVKCMPY
jgi:hypothetical protein